MDNNGSDEKKISGNDAAPTTIEIKIRSCRTHRTTTLRVDKSIRVSALKEQIAVVTGVVSDRQRLIYSGRLLYNHQLLSYYNVKDGDTLHMVTQENISNPRVLLGTTPTIPLLEDTIDAENRSNDGSAQVQENIEQATSSDAEFDQPESKRQKLE